MGALKQVLVSNDRASWFSMTTLSIMGALKLVLNDPKARLLTTILSVMGALKRGFSPS
jgi:hypothetical protein